MGRKIKKGVKGEASQYKTRSNAIRDLQLNLQDFRRLCIIKGVYPREPRKKFKGNDKTYFHTKDLKILQHDQLLSRFHEIKAHLKKHKKLIGRKEDKTAEVHMDRVPKLNLAPVIKDRYPTFVDALRDLDDALCMIALFAQLPQHLTLDVKKEDLDVCNQLYRDFMLYCTVAQTFTKSFFSIKGMYYRVEIMGVPITWVCPYKFNQRLPFDVDYKVMGTFLEFYRALLKFVNFKLFTDIGLSYPLAPEALPFNVSGSKKTSADTTLDCSKVKMLQKHYQKISRKAQSTASEFEDLGGQDDPQLAAMNKKTESLKKQKILFQNCHFLLGRETPIYILQHLIMSFGGNFTLQDDLTELEDIEDNGAAQKKADQMLAQVTHICMDRPMSDASASDKSKEHIVPQYVVDSLNNLFLLPTKSYTPGKPTPAHLSPFLDNVDAGYVPDRQREINTLAGVATAEVLDEESSEEEEQVVEKSKDKKAEESADEDLVGEKKDKDDSESDDESEEEEPETTKLTAAQKAKKDTKLKADLAKEQQEMGKMLMTQKQRKLYQKADQTKKAKEAAAKKLKDKKKVVVAAKASGAAPKAAPKKSTPVAPKAAKPTKAASKPVAKPASKPAAKSAPKAASKPVPKAKKAISKGKGKK